MNINLEKEVQVIDSSFTEFFDDSKFKLDHLIENDFPLAIDTYQRNYVWNANKINELISDLTTYLDDTKGLQYYMGSILLHKNNVKKKRFIIDGQQRITSLCVLFAVLKGRLPPPKLLDLTYTSEESEKNIKQAQLLFSLAKQKFAGSVDKLFSNITFTFITTLSEDLAFTFFDTQNNRGIKLAATDLLKAYHLRGVGGAESENVFTIQKQCAQSWEHIQSKSKRFSHHDSDTATELFRYFLLRAKQWRGRHNYYNYSDAGILKHFQVSTLKAENKMIVPLYSKPNSEFNNQIRWTEKNILLEKNNGPLRTHEPFDILTSKVHIPFSLRQPITAGIGFFMFAEKYDSLLDDLLTNETLDSEIESFRLFYQSVFISAKLAKYLKELFLLGSLVFFDRFGSSQLHAFSLYFEYLLGGIRLDKSSIQQATIVNFLNGSKENLLDVISMAFMPDEVIQFLKQQASTYSETYRKEEIPYTGNSVMPKYKKSMLKYYVQKNTPLKNKLLWIEALLQKGDKQ